MLSGSSSIWKSLFKTSHPLISCLGIGIGFTGTQFKLMRQSLFLICRWLNWGKGRNCVDNLYLNFIVPLNRPQQLKFMLLNRVLSQMHCFIFQLSMVFSLKKKKKKESQILCLNYKVKTSLAEFWSAWDSQVLQFLLPLDSIESRNWNEIKSTVIRRRSFRNTLICCLVTPLRPQGDCKGRSLPFSFPFSLFDIRSPGPKYISPSSQGLFYFKPSFK